MLIFCNCIFIRTANAQNVINISNNEGVSENPDIEVLQQNIYVVWYEYISDGFEIMYSKNFNNSWSEPVNISNTPDWSWFPQISANEDSVYIVWEEKTFTNSEIYFTGLSNPTTGVNENIGYLHHPGLNNYPNPFSESTVINYQVKFQGKVVLKIYDISGQEIRTLVNENQSTGKHTIVWDGTNDSGKNVGSGIYFCKIKSNKSFSETLKMLLLK